MAADRQIERVKGRATVATVRRGTGSEHTGVVLETSTGEQLILVRLGSNPFDDPATRELAGRTLEVEGYRLGKELRYVSARDVG